MHVYMKKLCFSKLSKSVDHGWKITRKIPVNNENRKETAMKSRKTQYILEIETLRLSLSRIINQICCQLSELTSQRIISFCKFSQHFIKKKLRQV